MPKFEKHVKKITQTLELQSMPIGARFSEGPDGKGIQPKLRICEAFDAVRQKNVVISLSKENCICAGGRHFAGLETLPLETLAVLLADKEHKIYESKNVAEATLNRQPQPVHRGSFLILGPLDKFETDPDIVIFFVNPAQADRILGLASFRGVEPFMHYPAVSICSTITHTLAKDKPDINFISIFERRRHKWSPNELIIALPFKDFLAVVESIPKSGFGKLS